MGGPNCESSSACSAPFDGNYHLPLPSHWANRGVSMAAVAIPLISSIADIIIPRIPVAITEVESILGPGHGPIKLQTVVNVLMAILQGKANTGAIPSAPVVDPNTPASIAALVQQVFDQISVKTSSGTVPAVTPVPSTSVSVSATSINVPIADFMALLSFAIGKIPK